MPDLTADDITALESHAAMLRERIEELKANPDIDKNEKAAAIARRKSRLDEITARIPKSKTS